MSKWHIARSRQTMSQATRDFGYGHERSNLNWNIKSYQFCKKLYITTCSVLSSIKAAKAGLYYTGEGDTVTCYSCGLRLNHWESGIQPTTVHRQFSPECQFVVTQLSDDVSAQQVVPQGRETRELQRQRRRRRGYDSRHDYYRQLASVAGSLRSPADTSTDWTSHVSPLVSSTLGNDNVDRFTSRHMMQRINNNDPSLLEEMKYERQRVSSYTNWPRDTIIEPEALAQAGLFYLCRADRVKCAFCQGILRNWEPSEEPMRKHRRLFPSCPFLRDPRAAGNVALGEEPGEQQMLTPSHGGGGSATGLLRQVASQQSCVSRESRSCWILQHRWQPNDDPMAKHRQLYPNCGFVRLMAEAHIEHTTDSESSQQLRSATGTTTTPATTAPTTPATTAPTRAATTTATTVATTSDFTQQRNSASSQNSTLTCKVCLDADMNTVFLPCGHLACCGNCASALSTCPICRTAIQGYVRTLSLRQLTAECDNVKEHTYQECVPTTVKDAFQQLKTHLFRRHYLPEHKHFFPFWIRIYNKVLDPDRLDNEFYS
ncbi:E3 ubiquitin-protein ligase XIAP [Lamellibrachia satsuma]|nr:E3 ubiquitin-protein ligase XIAP [Lamellibrachia satsuma]